VAVNRTKRRRWPILLRWVGFALCVGLFVNALAGADLTSAWDRIRAVGPIVLVILVPFPFALLMDAWAWQRLLAVIDRKVKLWPLFELRVAIEAVTNSAPVGPLWADALAPILLSRRAGIPAVDVFATITAKRWTVVRMHGAYVAFSAAVGATAMLHASRALLGNESLLVVTFASALVLIVMSYGFQALVAKAGLGARLSSRLERFERVRKWIESRRHEFSHADAQIAKLSQDAWAGAIASWRMLGLWVIEGIETYVILKLLGVQLSLFEVLSFDAALSVVRSAAMFAPAGIGVQDVGYLSVLQAYGVADAASVGPAFIVLKRVKEAIWMAIGFVILARSGPRALKEARDSVSHADEIRAIAPPGANDDQSPTQPPSAAT